MGFKLKVGMTAEMLSEGLCKLILCDKNFSRRHWNELFLFSISWKVSFRSRSYCRAVFLGKDPLLSSPWLTLTVNYRTSLPWQIKMQIVCERKITQVIALRVFASFAVIRIIMRINKIDAGSLELMFVTTSLFVLQRTFPTIQGKCFSHKFNFLKTFFCKSCSNIIHCHRKNEPKRLISTWRSLTSSFSSRLNDASMCLLLAHSVSRMKSFDSKLFTKKRQNKNRNKTKSVMMITSQSIAQ